MRKKYNPLFIIIIILSPIIIYWLTLLLPTFDDWTYFTSPDYDFGEHFYERLIPRFSYWRPWDGIFGYILSLNHNLFPALNHIAVYIAHAGGTYIIYKISQELKFSFLACNIAALYFFISPAMLGTVLGVDSINQAYASFWGLLATYSYLCGRNPKNTAAWLIFTTIGVFAKENAIVFFIIPPIISFAFGRITIRQGIKDYTWALLLIIVYFIARKMLSTDVVYINDEYFENTVARKLKNVCVFLGMTWLPLDFISLVHKPNRNLIITAATIICSFPFMAALFINKLKYYINIQFTALACCLIIAVSPHLATLFTAMHPYAGLGMAALIVGYMADKTEHADLLKKLLPLFIMSCAFIDWHHWQKSYESGLMGKKLAMDIIRRTDRPVKKLCVINVIGNEEKYSSFCVIPRDAFGWGLALKHYTEYKWPETIDNYDIEGYDTLAINRYADMITKQGFERVCVVHGDTIDIIR